MARYLTGRGGRGRKHPKFVDFHRWPDLIRAAKRDAQGKAREEILAVRNAALIALMLYTGLRLAEVCDMDLAHVTLDAGREQVFVANGKGNKERFVDLHAKAVELLREYLSLRPACREPDGREPFWLAFDSPTPARLGRRTIQHLAKQVGVACELPWLTAHCLRHSFATRLSEQSNGDTFLVQQALGHEDPATTAIYVGIRSPRRRKAIRGL